MNMKQLSKACSQAAKVIQRDGLLKGDYGANDGPKCVLGGLRFAVNGSTGVPLAFTLDELTPLFRKARPHSRRGTIVAFNDADRTRKHDVVELLQDMAVQALR